jgi:hypothetical protein
MRIFDPRAWVGAPNRELDIDEGRVGCPAHGDADLESCYFCGYMVTIEGDREPRVVCNYPTDSATAN